MNGSPHLPNLACSSQLTEPLSGGGTSAAQPVQVWSCESLEWELSDFDLEPDVEPAPFPPTPLSLSSSPSSPSLSEPGEPAGDGEEAGTPQCPG